jgi:hypothetical protein
LQPWPEKLATPVAIVRAVFRRAPPTARWHADCAAAPGMNIARLTLAAVLLLGCKDELPPEPQLECIDVSGATLCDDFNVGDTTTWTPEGGSWSVVDGRYVGMGPTALDPNLCGESLMTASLRTFSEATDLTMHAQLGSEARLDKTIVLRALDDANRIELNFRGAPINDLMVQELSDCVLTYHTAEGEIPVMQPEGERVDVDVDLRGSHLVVVVDGVVVVDRAFEFANTGEGRVGLAVIDNAITVFDDFYMTRL